MPSEKQYLVAELTEQLAEQRDLPADEVRPMAAEIVSEAVDLRPDPTAIGSGYDLVHESDGDVVSQKPSNVDVSLNFKTGLLVLSEMSAFASGDPVTVGSALAGLSAIIVTDGTVTLSEESACVYAIAAENWDLGSPFSQAALIEAVVDETTDRDDIGSLSPAAIKEALDELETVGCLSRWTDNGATCVALEERCIEYWD